MIERMSIYGFRSFSPYNPIDLELERVDFLLGATTIVEALKKTYLYQFNNTAPGSPIRSTSGIYDCAVLRLDGSNLAAYLRQLREVELCRPYYRRIVALVGTEAGSGGVCADEEW